MISEALRAAVVAEARTWRGTPYHHLGSGEQLRGRQLKGVGTDCAQLLIDVYSAAGVIDWFSTGKYSLDWMMHRDDERYVEIIERFADEFDWTARPILPADVVVWRYGRTFSHGGIVTEWPLIVHAFSPWGVVGEDDVSRPSELTLANNGRPRPMRAFRPKALLR